MTVSSTSALKHLRRIKPLDGWSIETKKEGDSTSLLRLCRRNVPLTDNYFLDIHHDSTTNQVVGILTHPKAGKSQAQVLVDDSGNLNGRKVNLVTIRTWDGPKPTTSSSTIFSSSNTTTTRGTTTSGGTGGGTSSAGGGADTPLSFQENTELLLYGGYLLAGVVILKVILQSMMIIYMLAFPLAYLYLVQTCPSDASFDTKQQLKRVMRGQYLPENHPDKPKGFFEETLARINATIATELATGIAGYTVEMTTLAGAATLVCVNVPAVKTNFYWLGAAGRWMYVYSNSTEEGNTTTTSSLRQSIPVERRSR